MDTETLAPGKHGTPRLFLCHKPSLQVITCVASIFGSLAKMPFAPHPKSKPQTLQGSFIVSLSLRQVSSFFHGFRLRLRVPVMRGLMEILVVVDIGPPNIRGTFLGIPRIRIIVFWGLYWGSPYFGKLPFVQSSGCCSKGIQHKYLCI